MPLFIFYRISNLINFTCCTSGTKSQHQLSFNSILYPINSFLRCRLDHIDLLSTPPLTNVTYIETVDLLIPDEILPLPLLHNPPLPPINDIDPHAMLPEAEIKTNAPPSLPADKATKIIASPLLLTNDSPSTIALQFNHHLIIDIRLNIYHYPPSISQSF